MVKSDTSTRWKYTGSAQLGELVESRRTMLGMTRGELAKKIGKSRSFVYQIEKGLYPITHEETVKSMADALTIHPYDIYAAEGMIPHDLNRLLAGMSAFDLRLAHEYIQKREESRDKYESRMKELYEKTDQPKTPRNQPV